MDTTQVWGKVMTGVAMHALGRRVGRGKGAREAGAEAANGEAEEGGGEVAVRRHRGRADAHVPAGIVPRRCERRGSR